MIASVIHRNLIAGPDAPEEQARPALIHVGALSASKIADGLADPKLVLAWLFGALGVPGAFTGALVPVRESGALLPQLALARMIQASRVRKYYWAAGATGQGLSALGMAAAALTLEGALAGGVIVGLLALLAVSRAICSASHKDILSRTVDKGTRGRVSGVAGTVGAAVVLGFAVALGVGLVPRDPAWVACAVALAGVLWLLAAAIFTRLREPEADLSDSSALDDLTRPIIEDREFRRYLAVRLLLVSTALAPPFLVMLASTEGDAAPGNLGVLMLASSLAAIASSWLWGWLSDRSSRQTLAFAGAMAAGTLAVAAGIGWSSGTIGGLWAAAFIFFAQIAYQGARAGRKTHLTDMDTGDRKATYTALSNSIVGVMLLAGGSFGLLADYAGVEVVLAIFAGMALCGGGLALGLSEVQRQG